MSLSPSVHTVLAVALLVLPAVAAERTPEEWRDELGRKYGAAESFRATYLAETPGKPAVEVLVMEARASGAAYVRLGPPDEGFMMWSELPEDGKSLFVRAGGETMEVKGMHRILKALDELQDGEGIRGPRGLPPIDPERPRFAATLDLGETSLSAGVGLSMQTLPWLDDEAFSKVREVRVKEDRVEFVCENGEFYAGDAETGMFLEHAMLVEGGMRRVRLEASAPLEELATFREAIPEFDAAAVKIVQAGDTSLGLQLTALLFQAYMRACLEAGMDQIAMENFCEEGEENLRNYWSAVFAGELPKGLPLRLLQDFAKEVVRPIYQRLLEEKPEAKGRLSYAAFIDLSRPKLEPIVRKVLETVPERSPLRHPAVMLEQLEAKYGGVEGELAAILGGAMRDAYWSSLVELFIEELKNLELE